MRTVQLPQQCQLIGGGVDAGPFAAARCFAFAGVSDPGYKGSADLCMNASAVCSSKPDENQCRAASSRSPPCKSGSLQNRLWRLGRDTSFTDMEFLSDEFSWKFA